MAGMVKRIFFVFVLMVFCFSIFGCAATGQTRVPNGKTYEANWGADEAYCLKKSGRVTGFLAASPIGWIINYAGGADKRNEDCLRALGWIE